MALTTITITTVTPRGGAAGTVVTVDGGGFGAATGLVRFDPLGEDLPAGITTWNPNQIVFTVPALATDNKFFLVSIEIAGGGDSIQFKFWVPVATIGAGFPPGLDYQLPSFEEGPLESVDDPKTSQASDFNRLADKVLQATAGVGDMAKSVYDTNDNAIVDKSEALDDSGTPRTWADIVALIGASVSLFPALDLFNPSAGQTSFSLSQTPGVTLPIIMFVNGIAYRKGALDDFTQSGTSVTWLNNEFTLSTSDRVEILYFL